MATAITSSTKASAVPAKCNALVPGLPVPEVVRPEFPVGSVLARHFVLQNYHVGYGLTLQTGRDRNNSSAFAGWPWGPSKAWVRTRARNAVASQRKQERIMGYKVAVVGATGNVGREILTTWPSAVSPPTRWWRWRLGRSVGKQVSFGENQVSSAGSGEVRFPGLGHRLVVARRKGFGCVLAQGGGGGLRHDRQHLPFPHGPGRAAGRARR